MPHTVGLRVADESRCMDQQQRTLGQQLKPAQEAHLVELWRAGKHTSAELPELLSHAPGQLPRHEQRRAASELMPAARMRWHGAGPRADWRRRVEPIVTDVREV